MRKGAGSAVKVVRSPRSTTIGKQKQAGVTQANFNQKYSVASHTSPLISNGSKVPLESTVKQGGGGPSQKLGSVQPRK